MCSLPLKFFVCVVRVVLIYFGVCFVRTTTRLVCAVMVTVNMQLRLPSGKLKRCAFTSYAIVSINKNGFKTVLDVFQSIGSDN